MSVIPQRSAKPTGLQTISCFTLFSGVGEGAACHPADCITVVIFFGEVIAVLVMWEVLLLLSTGEDLPEKLNIILSLHSNHGCVNMGNYLTSLYLTFLLL